MKSNIYLKIFNSTSVSLINPIRGGMMNSISLVAFNKEKFLVYEPVGNSNDLVNRNIEKTTHDIMFKLGLTSKNIYFDVNSGLKANVYIEGDSLNNVKKYDIKQIAELFKKYHNSNFKLESDYKPFSRLKEYEAERQKFQNDSIEYSVLRNFLNLNQKFLESQKMVLCHNDAQKSNLILGKDKKYYIIDFEFAANNDPIYDIATFGNDDVSEGYKLLKEYYKNDLNSEKEKRYYLWRIFISLQWYNVAISKHFNNQGKSLGHDFLLVAKHFLNNALDAFNKLKIND